MNSQTILLLDNGSSRRESTRTLRSLAARLAERSGERVHAVSLQHSNRIPATELGGVPASILEDFLERRLAAGDRKFLVIPLFFGMSRALTKAVPALCDALAERFGPFGLRQGAPLCPLPVGEPRLARILADNIATAERAGGVKASCVVLVDHGSPSPKVAATRRRLAEQLGPLLATGTRLEQAAMERRPGPEYDFNGPLLLDLLTDLASTGPRDPTVIAPLFLAPGRHAGPGGDIETICRDVESAHPGFETRRAPLVGAHPGLTEILFDRLTTLLREP